MYGSGTEVRLTLKFHILNADVGGNFQGIQITSGFFQIWRAEGVTTQYQLYCIALGSLFMSGLMLFAGWFHYV